MIVSVLIAAFASEKDSTSNGQLVIQEQGNLSIAIIVEGDAMDYQKLKDASTILKTCKGLDEQRQELKRPHDALLFKIGHQTRLK